MRRLLLPAIACCVAFQAGCFVETPFAPALTVSFPDARDGGTLPFEPGGRIRVHLGADAGHLCGVLRANVELVLSAAPPDAGFRAVATLWPQDVDGCAGHQGEVLLFHPEGGTVDVRASIAGAVNWKTAPLDAPRLAIAFGTEERDGLAVRVPVCVETNAIKGTITLQLSGAQLRTGSPASQAATPGSCPDGGGLSFASFVAVSSRARFDALASLDGAQLDPVRESHTLGTAIEPVEVKVTSDSDGGLPDAGALVQITAAVTVAGVPAGNTPVQFEVVPAASLLPAAVTTDELGYARTWLLVPDKASALRVDAVVGGTRDGLTLTRP